MFYVEQFQNKFDVLIMGGGHAGLEAAWSAYQFGLRVGIVSLPGVGLGSAPCNPAVGGVGKGQVVREIDALGGVMGILADKAGIQYRVLNESKGYAVQSTRIQIDKEKYSKYAEDLISETEIIVVRDRINKVLPKSGEYFTLEGDAGSYRSKKLIVTTGTFLAGMLHTGAEISTGGRVGKPSSNSIEDLFSKVKTLKKRFKTGTPPRIKRSSIDFSKMEPQPSDYGAVNFHWANDSYYRKQPQVDCYLTRTNDKALEIIRENKEKSPIFNGQIKGIGPRYCPSIEDKAFRYLDRNVHHVFVEPEGLDIDTFYPNGISTSLPKEVQLEFLRKIPGLEAAEIAVYGYAVEYDVVNTLDLKRTMEHKDVEGLYFAGQVCGTSGYEEAAGQGLMAGLNASLATLGKDPIILNRNESYIGVMLEDLVTYERDEPYRLFTARSENRLFIREDNSTFRMAKYRKSLGLHQSIDKYNEDFLVKFSILERACDEISYMPTKENVELFSSNSWGGLKEKITLSEVLQRSNVDPVSALKKVLNISGLSFDSRIVRAVAVSIKYRGYIVREEIENRNLRKLEDKKLDWRNLLTRKNLSFECKQRIEKIKPETFGQLKRIEGIRPATLAFIASGL